MISSKYLYLLNNLAKMHFTSFTPHAKKKENRKILIGGKV